MDLHPVPALYELDENGEANGTVLPFCSDKCRNSYPYRTAGYAKDPTYLEDFGFDPQCQQCGMIL